MSVSPKVAIDPGAIERRLPSGLITLTVVAPGSGTIVTGSAGGKLWLGTLGGSIHSLRFCIRIGEAIRSGRADSGRAKPNSTPAGRPPRKRKKRGREAGCTRRADLPPPG